METLFNNIQKRIADNIEWLHGQVDEDYGQLDMLYRQDEDSETYPMVYPMVLIDTPEVQWQTLGGVGGTMQKGTVNVIVKLAIDCYDDTHYTSGTAEKAAERMEKTRQVHSLLQMYRPECCQTPMQRKRSRYYTMPRGIKIYEMHYETTVWEDGSLSKE